MEPLYLARRRRSSGQDRVVVALLGYGMEEPAASTLTRDLDLAKVDLQLRDTRSLELNTIGVVGMEGQLLMVQNATGVVFL